MWYLNLAALFFFPGLQGALQLVELDGDEPHRDRHRRREDGAHHRLQQRSIAILMIQRLPTEWGIVTET